MDNLSYNLVSAIGSVNSACTKANVSWQILKYPSEMKYTALITPILNAPSKEEEDRWGATVVEAPYIDELLEKIINTAETFN